MPVITKPATATALVTERAVRAILDAGILPDGALQLICGSTGDLLDHLGPQDVLAFTGSADTARQLRSRPHMLAGQRPLQHRGRQLERRGAGARRGSRQRRVRSCSSRDVAREITQKAGQKCTAIRRVLVPREHLDAVREALDRAARQGRDRQSRRRRGDHGPARHREPARATPCAECGELVASGARSGLRDRTGDGRWRLLPRSDTPARPTTPAR